MKDPRNNAFAHVSELMVKSVTPVDEGKRMGIAPMTQQQECDAAGVCLRNACGCRATLDSARLDELERLWKSGELWAHPGRSVAVAEGEQWLGYDTLREAADASMEAK